MATATNPISVAYGAIWTALNAWPAFNGPNGLVKPGPSTQLNAQIKGYDITTTAQAADRAAVRLGEGRTSGRPYQRNSKAIEITIDYPLQIMTDSFLVDKADLLEIVCLQALTNADGPNPGTLGQPVINKWEIKPGEFVQRDKVTKRPGWGVGLTVGITLIVNRAEFLATTYT